MVLTITGVEVKDKPWNAFADSAGALDCQELKVGIVEKGTVSGQTSLIIALKDNLTGMVHIAEITGNQFEGLISAYRGMDAKYKARR